MILLAVILWQMASRGGSSSREQEPSYTEFLDQLDKGNLREVTITLSQNSAKVNGEYRDSSGTNTKFRLVVPKESMSDLTKQLRDKRVQMHVTETSEPSLLAILLNLTPILLFVGLWIFMIRQMQRSEERRVGKECRL